MEKNPTTLITGASSGIGRATAFALAEKKHNLILTARRKNKLETLKSELTQRFDIEVHILVFDITQKDEVEKAINKIKTFTNAIDILINNAGLALELNGIDEGLIEDWETMIDTNIKGVLYISKFCFPLLKKSRNPLIINIGSIAGKETYPKGNVYCATKHAIDSLSKAMRMDLVKHGIKVTQVCPGATETEFSLVRYKGDKEKAKEVYNGFTPLKGEDIANIIAFIVDLPEHVNINDILIMPKQQAASGILFKNDY